ncbi:SRPBCC family protein [Mycobacterium kubicae]|uniref:SRPBCC family protein n=1 Tax=Mycobacterium kubicae TaxID=120959 RepID=UPI0007FEB605|nr:SRPBCC family protein [Mycobacterium kubicae]OBK44442.1 cyclase [Mycobacterium kubicae]
MVLDGGVAQISRSTKIPATVQAVWNVLADFGSLSSWADNADHSCLLNHGPDGELLGSTRRVQVGSNVLVERVTECEAPTSLAYDIEGLPSRLGKLANRWTLRPADDGTVVTLTSTVEVGTSPLARAAEWVTLRVMTKQSDSMLAGLAQQLEDTHV